MMLGGISALHILLGTIGLLAGTAALFAKKGAKNHRRAGNIFFVTMMIVSVVGAFLAYIKSDIPFSTALFTSFLGLFTGYLIFTSWITVKHKEGYVGHAEKAALIYILAVAVLALTVGLDASRTDINSINGAQSMPVEVFYFYAGFAAFVAIGDIKIILCKGIYGTQRIARHLWRMCLGFFIAAGTLFIGNPQVFPEYLQQAEVLAMPVLTFPVLAILVLTVFWLVKVLFFSRRVKAK
jgi:uncharacterized membrane protein